MTLSEAMVVTPMRPEAERLAVELAGLPPAQIDAAISRYVDQAVRELELSDLPKENVVQTALALLMNEREQMLRMERE